MRGDDKQQASMFSYLTMEQRIPVDHPLRRIRAMADRALEKLDGVFDELYSEAGRPSIAPERLLLGVIEEARELQLLSEEHFTVDGTLLQTC